VVGFPGRVFNEEAIHFAVGGPLAIAGIVVVDQVGLPHGCAIATAPLLAMDARAAYEAFVERAGIVVFDDVRIARIFE
jgi:hypothetical protein